MQAKLIYKRERLHSLLKGYGRVAVAFSGGVDSALVAKAAMLACGQHAVAVTAVSPSLAEGELDIARHAAAAIGIRHEIISTDEFAVQGYRANAGDRCYYCKTELYEVLAAQLPGLNADVICNGANLDDCGDHRPGTRAAVEHGIRSPLIEAEFTKQDVRDLAQHWELPVWDKPAAPCLSSRIAYGVEVTPARVRQVDRAEQFLKSELQLRELRVRLEANDLARIELPLQALSLLADAARCRMIVAKFHELGFRYITVDLEGFRSGSLNSSLPLVALEISSSNRVRKE